MLQNSKACHTVLTLMNTCDAWLEIYDYFITSFWYNNFLYRCIVPLGHKGEFMIRR